MSQVIWVPGLGNTTTFDGAPIPQGGHMVTPPPSSTSSPGGSSSGVQESPQMYHHSDGGDSSGVTWGLQPPQVYHGGGGIDQHAAAAAAAATAAAAAAAQAAAQATAARNARLLEKQNNNAWSNDAGIRSVEERAWDIYVDTGRWDTPEQIQYHKQAEDMRKALNPMYQGSGPAGPITQGDQNKISLPNVPADPQIGTIVKYGVLGLGFLVAVSMFKG